VWEIGSFNARDEADGRGRKATKWRAAETKNTAIEFSTEFDDRAEAAEKKIKKE
jgi:hypothetical protein